MPKPPEFPIDFFVDPWFSSKASGELLSTIEPQATRWGKEAFYRTLVHVRSAREKMVPTNIILLKHNPTNLEVEGERVGILLGLIVSWSGGDIELKQIVEAARLSILETKYQKFKATLESRYGDSGTPLILLKKRPKS